MAGDTVIVQQSGDGVTVAVETVTVLDVGTPGASAAPFPDNTALVKNAADGTRQLVVSAAGISPGTTRTLTAPDASGTLALLNVANTFTVAQTFTSIGFGASVGTKILLYDAGGVTSGQYGFAIEAGTLVIFYDGSALCTFRSGGPSGTEIVSFVDAFGVRLTTAANQIYLSGYSGTIKINNVVQVGGNGTPSAGTFGVFGATPAGQQAVGNAAADAASTQTLANNLRTALINLGFCKT